MKILGEIKPPLDQIPDDILRKWPDDISIFVINNGTVPDGIQSERCIAFAEDHSGSDVVAAAVKHGLKHVISCDTPFFFKSG